MIRSFGILFLLIFCMAVSGGNDWLEGGYVGRGDYSEARQYFDDPIFYPQGNNQYAVTDPAIRDMLISLDMPGGSVPGPFDPAIRQMEASLDFPRSYGTASPVSIGLTKGQYTTTYSPKNVIGRLQISLSDGTVMDLMLYGYQNSIYGQGSIKQGGNVRWATARGQMYGSILQIGVVPTNGIMQYSISIDTARRDMPGKYTVYEYGYGIKPISGTVSARWLPV